MAARRKGFTKFRQSEGDEGIRRVAVDYAVSDVFSNMEEIAEKYGINEEGLREAIAFAIENCLITHKLALECKKKANFNQRRHIRKNDKVLADEYYDKILAKRREYVKSIRDERVLKLVEFYISCARFSLTEIADAVGFSIEELNDILKNAIVFELVSDEAAQRIIDTATKKAYASKKERVVTTFNRYLEYRRTHKELVEAIQYYEFQVDTYDSSRIDEEGAPSKDELESRLETARRNLEDFEKLF